MDTNRKNILIEKLKRRKGEPLWNGEPIKDIKSRNNTIQGIETALQKKDITLDEDTIKKVNKFLQEQCKEDKKYRQVEYSCIITDEVIDKIKNY